MAGRDPLFEPWEGARVGDPVLVRTVEGAPSYWLVPVERDGRAIGFVRVMGTGRVAAAGAYYRDVRSVADSPVVVTRISGEDAAEMALAYVGDKSGARGDVVAGPMFVHDGPPGREAWLVEVEVGGGERRRMFVSPGGVYE
jgi:hypothetical protein